MLAAYKVRNEGIIEWLGMKGTIKRSSHSNAPAMGRAATKKKNQAAQNSIQPSLEHLQGWGTHNFPGQPVPVPHSGEKFL